MKCYSTVEFKKYFEENMNDLGLLVPTGIFETYTVAVGHAGVMSSAISSLGKGATMMELAKATFISEKIALLGAIGASAYTGAVIGSIAVATGRTVSCGSRIADVFALINQNNMQFPGYAAFYKRNPEVLNKDINFRNRFAVRARLYPSSFEYA